MLPFIRCGRMVDAIRRPVRSVPFVSRSLVRRSSSGSDEQSLELVLKNITGLEDDIRNLQSNFITYNNDYLVFKRDYEGKNDDLTILQSEQANFADEFSNLKGDLQNYMTDFQSFKSNFEGRIAMLEKNIDTRFDEIGNEIEKTNTIPVVSKSSVRRSSGGSEGAVLETILETSAKLRDDIQLLHGCASFPEGKFWDLAKIPAKNANDLGDVTDELSKHSAEFSNINRGTRNHKESFENFEANIEERMIALENKTRGKLEGIEQEIKNAISIHSLESKEHRGKDVLMAGSRDPGHE